MTYPTGVIDRPLPKERRRCLSHVAPVLVVLLQLLASLEVAASEPIEVLSANGLSKAGKYFVVVARNRPSRA